MVSHQWAADIFLKISGPKITKALINILMPLCITPRHSTHTHRSTRSDVNSVKCTDKKKHKYANWYLQWDGHPVPEAQFFRFVNLDLLFIWAWEVFFSLHKLMAQNYNTYFPLAKYPHVRPGFLAPLRWSSRLVFLVFWSLCTCFSSAHQGCSIKDRLKRNCCLFVGGNQGL